VVRKSVGPQGLCRFESGRPHQSFGDTAMAINLSNILPNASQTLDGAGFLFGSGTSFEAGYPLMEGLTQQVMTAIGTDHRAVLDEALAAAGKSYDSTAATPNIEELADLVLAHWANSGDPRFSRLEARFRELILECILAVKNPNLEHHIRFFDALKKRAFGLSCTVWIFTTNYDLLFETAASLAGVFVENGFCGTTDRFFNSSQFKNTYGTIAVQRFTPCANLTVKLIKLHGSTSWYEKDAQYYERHPDGIDAAMRRVMVLPRRRKVMDTLTPPYDALFTHASKALGGECKYLVSCGFNYGDEHINQHILLPPMMAKKCRLFVLAQEEPAGIAAFKAMPNFQGGFDTHLHQNGTRVDEKTSAWKFSNFVSLFD
jgi:SIR2-like domain